MPANKWLAAAARYRANPQLAPDTQAQLAAERAKKAEVARQRYHIEVVTLSSQLVVFIASAEGQSALALLEASGCQVRLGVEEDQATGLCAVYSLGATGLQVYSEHSDLKLREAYPPTAGPADPDEVAKVLIRQGAVPKDVLRDIRAQLDDIAQAAP